MGIWDRTILKVNCSLFYFKAFLFIASGIKDVGGYFLFLTDGIVEITLSMESALASLGYDPPRTAALDLDPDLSIVWALEVRVKLYRLS